MEHSIEEHSALQSYLVDGMLMSLGRWLRLVGLDVANPKGADDQGLLANADRESRILLTRDKQLHASCKAVGVKCILINSTSLKEQLKEMALTGVRMELDPKRCTICNGLLREMPIEEGRMKEFQNSRNKIWQCDACKKTYWAGSHWRKIEDALEEIRLEMGLH
jgi:uncharacterized protein